MSVSLDRYDRCAIQSIADLETNNAAGTLVGDIYTMQPFPPGTASAIRQVSSQHFNSPGMTSDEAVQAMLDAVELAK